MLLVASFGIICGVVLGFYLHTPLFVLWLVLACMVGMIFLLKQQKVLAVLLFFVLLLIGLIRVNSSLKPSGLEKWWGSVRKFQGEVVRVQQTQDWMKIWVRPESVRRDVLLFATKNLDVEVGSVVEVEGKVEKPENFSDFNYQGYLLAQGVEAVSFRSRVYILERPRLLNFKAQLARINRSATGRIQKLISGDSGVLVSGMLLGGTGGSQRLTQILQSTGLSHIVAVSGYNVTILLIGCWWLVRMLGRKQTLLFTTCLVVLFVFLTGGGASVLRAGVMGVVVISAKFFERRLNVGRVIIYTVGIMLFVNPLMLFWDVGFQLSVLATVGVVYGTPGVVKLLGKLWLPRKIVEVLATSLAAIVMTLPLIAYTFGQVSSVAVLSNLIVVPLVPIIMLLGFLLFIPGIGEGLAWYTDHGIRLLIKILESLGSWSGAVWRFKPGPFELVFAYILIVVFYCGLSERNDPNLEKAGDAWYNRT